MNPIVSFVDVGQGDCTLAVDADARTGVMVDCPQNRGNAALQELQRRGADEVAVIVVTHSDLDHLGGVPTVASNIPTRSIRLNEATVVPSDPEERIKLKSALRSISSLRHRGVTLDNARRGDAGAAGRLSWSILTPDLSQLLYAQGTSNPNHASVVLRIDVDSVRVVIAGDADGRSWRTLLDAGIDVRAEILLVPHHGAEMGTSGKSLARLPEVLAVVAPTFAVLSFGAKNLYGHPAPATTEILAVRDIPVCATAPLPDRAPSPRVLQVGTVRFAIEHSSLTLF